MRENKRFECPACNKKVSFLTDNFGGVCSACEKEIAADLEIVRPIDPIVDDVLCWGCAAPNCHGCWVNPCTRGGAS